MKYEDTANGARQALLDMSVYTAEDLGLAVPDPWFAGVWKVRHKNTKTASIVYLAGYKEATGHIREENDFEDVDLDG